MSARTATRLYRREASGLPGTTTSEAVIRLGSRAGPQPAGGGSPTGPVGRGAGTGVVGVVVTGGAGAGVVGVVVTGGVVAGGVGAGVVGVITGGVVGPGVGAGAVGVPYPSFDRVFRAPSISP